MMYIKLKAQKMLIGENGKAFLVSVLPHLLAFSLLSFNYYLLIFFKNNAEIPLFYKIFVGAISGAFSLFMINSVWFISENYFFRKATDSFAPVGAKDLFCSFAVKILKALLFFSWCAVFFLPSAVLIYSSYFASTNGEPREIAVTLFVSSLVTFSVGAGCFFVLWGRYSKVSFVQFTTGETNPVKVLAESTELMEEKQIKYALFRLSFFGWDLLCSLLFPIIYVLPYRKCAKYVFFSEPARKKQKAILSDKPIVFIFG